MSTSPESESTRRRGAAARGAGTLAADTKQEQRRLILFVSAMLAFGIGCWFAYPHASRLTKVWLGRRHLPELRQQLKEEHWPQAAAAMREARRWAPEDSEVLHASLEFHTVVGGDPRNALSLIRRLQETGHATTDDLVLMGKAHVKLGEVAKAREIYERLPAEARQTQHGLELEAALLRAAGREEEAAEVLRRALLKHADDPASLQQLAAMELQSNDPSRRSAMRERLWKEVRSGSGSAISLVAIALLAQTRALTVPQAEELFQVIEAAPAGARRDEVRLTVMSARLRLSPHQRREWIDQEVMRWKNRPPAQTALLIQWLAAEKENARILRMVPAQTAARYTDLLPAYVDALRGEGQWKELHALLSTGGIDAAFSPQKIRLWQVEVQSHLQPDPTQARQTLMRIYEEAGRGDDLPITLQAGALAEQINQWDLAQKCYEAVASKHVGARQTMLAKIYQMADYQHDGAGMLEACTRLLALQPESQMLLTQKLYLKLLLGIELELAQQELQTALKAATARSDELGLLQALGAYRAGHLEELPGLLRKIAAPEAFAAGERSVYAALLKTAGGDAGKVFRLVERVSPTLLLPEEKVFLQRAL